MSTVITAPEATAFTVAASGTNYGLQVDEATASAATGLKITAAAAGSGLAVSTLSSGTNENLTVNAKGSGTITLGGTSTGHVILATGGGNVGINVASPSTTLELASSVARYAVFNSTATNGGFIELQKSGTGTTGRLGTRLSIAGSGSANDFLITAGDGGLYFNGNATINVMTTFQPASDNAILCGASGQRWSAVWAANGTIQTSDVRAKKDISDCRLGLDFINALRPVAYRWIQDDGRAHFGLVAQDVDAVAPESAFIYKENAESWGMNYAEFIGPIIRGVQELHVNQSSLRDSLAETLERAAAQITDLLRRVQQLEAAGAASR